ncbi:uncharacterized protein LOC141706780 [Apium graveolens]|uniref:uncharacterized protein LOC141706780 n=1 Tax=Apium graveolens TaxID=4045 RepID=UPI003D7921BB
MNIYRLCSRQTVSNLSRLSSRIVSNSAHLYINASPLSTLLDYGNGGFSVFENRKGVKGEKPFWGFSSRRFYQSVQELGVESDVEDVDDDGSMNEFLSRLVWIMRGKLSAVYTNSDKQTIDAMLLIIVSKVVAEIDKSGLESMLSSLVNVRGDDFSEDLWRTVWEVSTTVLEDMERARKKEKMKTFLQDDEVREMYKFAGEIGVRGEMLRELRFKWAREKLEESEFYESLKCLREEEVKAQEADESGIVREGETIESGPLPSGPFSLGENQKVFTLPKRHGKIKYKIYGLDLSDPKWAEVANKIHQTGEILWPQDAKPISGKCKLVTEKILSLQADDDVSPLLAEWVELLSPRRIDWIALLDTLKEQNDPIYYKVAELLLEEESFQTNIRDYSKLIDAHAKENRLDDAERILKKMNEAGIIPDILTLNVLVHMYSKAGNLDRTKEAFDSLRSQGFVPDVKVYNAYIMACVNAGKPKLAESIVTEMETRDIKPTEEIYMDLLRSFVRACDIIGTQRIATTMQFAGFHPTKEFCRLLVEAYGQTGDPDQARHQFDHMLSMGHKADDRSTASMIAAYETKNLLDKALDLLLQLEKDGFEPGVATYSVLVDWFGQLQLVEEAEDLLSKITELGEAPPLKLHISLCDMYLKAGIEKKALQVLGVIESKKDQLTHEEFERVIRSLINGRFAQDAKRVQGLMETRGFTASDHLKVHLMAIETLKNTKRPTWSKPMSQVKR